MIPLPVVRFKSLILTVTHDLAHKILNALTFDLLRWQVLTVIPIYGICGFRDLNMDRFFETATVRNTDTECHWIGVTIYLNVVVVTFLGLGLQSILNNDYFYLAADTHSDRSVLSRVNSEGTFSALLLLWLIRKLGDDSALL